MFRHTIFVLIVIASACGKNAAPTSPSSTPASAAPVIVAPPFTGRFVGSFSPACLMFGPRAIAMGCAHWMSESSAWRTVTLNLTQSSDLRAVTGTVQFGANAITISNGSVGSNGTLTFVGSATFSDGTKWTVDNFSATANGTTLSLSFGLAEQRGATGDEIYAISGVMTAVKQ